MTGQPDPYSVVRCAVCGVVRRSHSGGDHEWVPDPEEARALTDDWLREHGDDLIPVRLIDLLSAVGRLEQADREGKIEHDGSSSWTCCPSCLVTCDLPRLRRYLPVQAIRELES